MIIRLGEGKYEKKTWGIMEWLGMEVYKRNTKCRDWKKEVEKWQTEEN